MSLRLLLAPLAALLVLLAPRPAAAFCGLYVARADTRLYNESSKVVVVRDGDRTVLTMASDYEGDARDFALVVPVPTAITRQQVHVGEMAPIDHLDAFTAPRLVEYHDPDPCRPPVAWEAEPRAGVAMMTMRRKAEDALGVKVEASFTVGEYDILVLSAQEAQGLLTWLRREGYRLPREARPVLQSYIRQGLRFFVARVNLEEQARLGLTFLRPIQVAYESPRFVIPIRLGTVNARGAQDLTVWAITRGHRVEAVNYRNARIPTGVEVPGFVRASFAEVYRAAFAHQVEREGMATVFTEHAWDMGWCDPCAADPLTVGELRSLGVFWLPRDAGRGAGRGVEAYVTRLHVRYDRAHFPEDLRLQVTGDDTNYQVRFVLRTPWEGPMDCPQAREYRRELADRAARQARNLADLTGWSLASIRERMGAEASPAPPEERPWYEDLWGD